MSWLVGIERAHPLVQPLELAVRANLLGLPDALGIPFGKYKYASRVVGWDAALPGVVITSRNGSETAAPMPRSMVRREMRFACS
ncbi:MAG: hypothetical protein R2748_17200 [Bryobacterales bacterium]